MPGVASLAKVAGVAANAEVRAGLCACKSAFIALDCDDGAIFEIWRSAYRISEATSEVSQRSNYLARECAA